MSVNYIYRDTDGWVITEDWKLLMKDPLVGGDCLLNTSNTITKIEKEGESE